MFRFLFYYSKIVLEFKYCGKIIVIREIINIEVQVRKEDNYRKRSLYYWSKSYGETILGSEGYENLKKTIVINILGYIEVIESNKLHTIFKIMEQEEHFQLLEDLQIHYLELPKLSKKRIEELNKVELWLDFLREAGKEGNEKRLKGLMERSETMKTAINKLQEISSDEKMRELYRAREKYRIDMISKLKYAENKGREEGRESSIREIARKAITKGLDIQYISDLTGLTIEQIGKLKNEIEN
ncbi:Rpn family recombination-promoting nuclease/putative transposase [Tissierella pigra]|uniref:Rpn family recombination-promoting nuclease/putative transposase n=1 Tax=Tissierella pigra TaxID=2607614 RepID=A0A6N7XUA4_9FIRM|nr:Rpn family recombination-promoting nuclease/putative transposase [Tissierella pigra]MSU00124.1 Rpn family recombination-promoting nuclease/putative transposase [Tissierella pigra]